MTDRPTDGPSSVEARPGTLSTTPPPDLPPVEPRPEPAAETAPKPPKGRPTTRAGRRAQSAAKRAQQATKAETTPKASSKPPPRRESLERRIGGAIASMGTGIAVAGAATGSEAVQADGLLVVQAAPNIAAALDKLAKDNPAVAVTLERMLTAGAWSGVIAAVTPVALGIAANHGALPRPLLDALGAGQAPPAPDGT